jgi:excisionase family DNA binding protein
MSDPQPLEPRWYTVSEFSRLTSVTRVHTYRLIREGKIHVSRPARKLIRINVHEIERFMGEPIPK